MENQFLQVPNVIDDYKNGLSLSKLTKKYSMSIYAIRKILINNDVLIRPAFISKIDKAKHHIIELYKNGLDSYKIGKKLGIAATNIRKCLKQQGIARRIRQQYCKQYPINIDVFKDPSNEITSYWIGFLMADGHLRINSKQTHLIKIKLQGKDIQHLYNFAQDLHTTKQPKLYDSVSPLGKPIKIAQILIMNKELYELFTSYGVKEFKRTGNIILPTTINMQHWLRGLIDGDGIVTLNDKKKRLVIGFICPKRKAVEFVRKFINSIIDFPRINKIQSKLNPKSKKSTYVTYWSGFYAIKLAKFLYFNSYRYLKRKWLRVEPFIFNNN